MTLLQKIKSLTWWNEVVKLQSILLELNTSDEDLSTRISNISADIGTSGLQGIVERGSLYQGEKGVLGFGELGDLEEGVTAYATVGGLISRTPGTLVRHNTFDATGSIALYMQASSDKELLFYLPGDKDAGDYTLATTSDLDLKADLEQLDLKQDLLSLGSTTDYRRGDNLLGVFATDVDERITAQKGVANGVAPLESDGKISSTYLSVTTLNNTFVVVNQAAMLGLSAAKGDVAIRTDLSKSYILQNTPASTLGNWLELLSPAGGVTTIFARSGAVSAQTGDYTADQITETTTRKFQSANQKLYNDATSSIQTQLNTKSPIASPSFTGVPLAPTAVANTNTTQLATTAFVLNQAGTVTPLIDGTATVGVSKKFAREDHKHPTDTTKVDKINGVTQITDSNAYVYTGIAGGATQAVINAKSNEMMAKVNELYKLTFTPPSRNIASVSSMAGGYNPVNVTTLGARNTIMNQDGNYTPNFSLPLETTQSGWFCLFRNNGCGFDATMAKTNTSMVNPITLACAQNNVEYWWHWDSKNNVWNFWGSR